MVVTDVSLAMRRATRRWRTPRSACGKTRRADAPTPRAGGRAGVPRFRLGDVRREPAASLRALRDGSSRHPRVDEQPRGPVGDASTPRASRRRPRGARASLLGRAVPRDGVRPRARLRLRAPSALRSIFNLAAAAAERGLVPYQAVRSAHGQLRSLGLLTCDRVDPTPVDDDDRRRVTPGNSSRPRRSAEPPPRLPSRSRPKASPSFAARSGRGSRPRWRTRETSRRRDARIVRPGELDATGRSAPAVRGDVIAWLSGDEGLDEDARDRAEPAPVRAGAVAQLLRSCLSDHLASSMPSGALAPSDAYATNAMLSVYAPGGGGFAPHRDHCGPSEPRRITAVYYPNRADWGNRTAGG